jgi:hypothetical protein
LALRFFLFRPVRRLGSIGCTLRAKGTLTAGGVRRQLRDDGNDVPDPQCLLVVHQHVARPRACGHTSNAGDTGQFFFDPRLQSLRAAKAPHMQPGATRNGRVDDHN